jgi:DNA-3-methyladenine glycosylase II
VVSAVFSVNNFQALCDQLAACDNDLQDIIRRYGYPPMWNRPNTFESLVHIILEQQVSLASALAALNQLRKKISSVTPQQLLLLSDEELKACYFSRQKMGYARHLAEAIINQKIDLDALSLLPDEEVREKMLALKGIGHWTIDVYLIFVLQRADIFPLGDLAAVNALKQLKSLPKHASREHLMEITSSWQPFRSIATMLLWHFYLSRRIKT